MIRVVNVRGLNTREGRAAVVYVGRQCYGWRAHDLANPFKPAIRIFDGDTKAECAGERERAVRACLDKYRDWLSKRVTLESDLAALWEQTGHGAKPLGCWCCDAVVDDGQPVCCHAQIIAAMLHERFEKASSP